MGYKTGTVNVTNGSATVDGVGTSFLANVPVNSMFTVPGHGVAYQVAAVITDTQLTLAAPYMGTSLVGTAYNVITNQFTPFRAYPYPVRGDIETAAILQRALAMIDQDMQFASDTGEGFVFLIRTRNSGNLSNQGGAYTQAGTLTHPTPDESYGYMGNFASAASAAATAGLSSSENFFRRGTLANRANGFFFRSRLAFPDASYDQTGASTGSRLFVGLTDGAMSAVVDSDNAAGSHVGFQRCHSDAGRQDANWQLMTRDGATQSLVDTGMAFTPQNVYSFQLHSDPVGSDISWRIDNDTLGTYKEGVVTANLPAGATSLKAGFQLETVNAIARNIRMQQVLASARR